MKTSTKWAALALGAASMSAMMALPAFADDSVANSNNCQNIRTITTSHCVHYDEKKRDGWANQQANKANKQGDDILDPNSKASKDARNNANKMLPDGTLRRDSKGTIIVGSGPDGPSITVFHSGPGWGYSSTTSGGMTITRMNGLSGGSGGARSAR